MKQALCVISLALLSGCASSPITTETGRAASPDRVFHQNSAVSNAATFLITRDTAFQGVICQYKISINDKPAALLQAGEFVKLKVAPGQYLLRLDNDSAICPNDTATVFTIAAADDSQEFRISINASNLVRLSRIK